MKKVLIGFLIIVVGSVATLVALQKTAVKVTKASLESYNQVVKDATESYNQIAKEAAAEYNDMVKEASAEYNDMVKEVMDDYTETVAEVSAEYNAAVSEAVEEIASVVEAESPVLAKWRSEVEASNTRILSPTDIMQLDLLMRSCDYASSSEQLNIAIMVSTTYVEYRWDGLSPKQQEFLATCFEIVSVL